jgi:hypothetical protein
MTHSFQVGQRVAEKVSGRIGRVTKSGTIFEGDKPYAFYEVPWEDDGTSRVAAEDLKAAPIAC